MYHVLLLLLFFLSHCVKWKISMILKLSLGQPPDQFSGVSFAFFIHHYAGNPKSLWGKKKGKENSHNHIGFWKFQSSNIFSALGCVWMDLATEVMWEKCLWLTLLTISLYYDKKLHYVKDSIIFLFCNYHIEKLKGFFFFFANWSCLLSLLLFVFTCRMCLLICNFSSI